MPNFSLSSPLLKPLLCMLLLSLASVPSAQAAGKKQQTAYKQPVLIMERNTVQQIRNMGGAERVGFVRRFERQYDAHGENVMNSHGLVRPSDYMEQKRKIEKAQRMGRLTGAQKAAYQERIRTARKYATVKAFGSSNDTYRADPIRRRAPQETDADRPYAVKRGQGFGDVGMHNQHDSGRGEVVYRDDDYRRRYIQQREQWEKDRKANLNSVNPVRPILSQRDQVEYSAVAEEGFRAQQAKAAIARESLAQQERDRIRGPFARRAVTRQDIGSFDNRDNMFQRDRYKGVYSNRFDRGERARQGSYSFSARDNVAYARANEFQRTAVRPGYTEEQAVKALTFKPDDRYVDLPDRRTRLPMLPGDRRDDRIGWAANRQAVQKTAPDAYGRRVQDVPLQLRNQGIYPLLGRPSDVVGEDKVYIPFGRFMDPNPDRLAKEEEPVRRQEIGGGAAPLY